MDGEHELTLSFATKIILNENRRERHICTRLSEKCLSFANVVFTTVHLRIKVKTKSAKCRDVYLNRTKWIVRNRIK